MRDRQVLAGVLDPNCLLGLVEPIAAGDAALRIQKLLVQCAYRLQSHGHDLREPVHVMFVPGRIEVLGKHTDYAGGRSLLAAVDRGICLVAAARDDEVMIVTDVLTNESTAARLTVELQPQPGWSNYPITVARRAMRNFGGPLRGIDLTFASSLPSAAGMSSSSALLIAVFLALSAVNGLPATAAYQQNIQSPEDLADYLAAVESGRDYRGLSGGLGVGTSGGSEDHTAILCARPGELVQYAFLPVRLERSIQIPPGYVFCIGVSGVAAEKTGAARTRYNRAAEQMQRALAHWATLPDSRNETLMCAVEADPAAADRLRRTIRDSLDHNTSAALLARVDQFLQESCVLIPAAADALLRGDIETFGRTVDRSQRLAEIALENQIPQTIRLAGLARRLGARAASAFGAGFGGSVWAMIEEANVSPFLARWRSAYLAEFPNASGAAGFFQTHAGGPAVSLS